MDGKAGIELRLRDWPDFQTALASHRYLRWWTRPAWIKSPGELPEQTQFLLVQRPPAIGGYLAVLPLTSGGMRTELRGHDGHAAFLSRSFDSQFSPCGFLLAALAIGDDPYELTARLFEAALAAVGTGRLRRQKPVPPFVEDFGWCSWNAFYSTVTKEDVTAALNTFNEGKLPVGFYILDDGWQDVGQYESKDNKGQPYQGDARPWGLRSFGANPKFPSGLAALIKRVKSATGLRHFGVWHTLQGYWSGLHPQGELAKRYETYVNLWGHCFARPQESYRLFHDYHAHLRDCGVDFVKVDNQSTLEGAIEGFYPIGEAARIVHQALDGSAGVHFLGQVINCMAMSSDILLQLPLTNVARNSDDYFPFRPNNPGEHVAYNAYNNLWTGQVAIPDWDMFESHHPYGAFHAMARAVSGSPIYCTDYPGRQDFDLLRKLVLSDGRALRCPQQAQVTRDCLLADPMHEPVLLKVFNRLPTGHGLLGVFNCRVTDGVQEKPREYTVFSDAQRAELSATAEAGPADVEGLSAETYAVYSHRAGQLWRMGRGERRTIRLVKFDSDVLVLAPIINGVAVLGLIDKFNSPAAIQQIFPCTALEFRLADGGIVGLYAQRRPAAITVDDKPAADYAYDPASGLLTLPVPAGNPVTIRVTP